MSTVIKNPTRAVELAAHRAVFHLQYNSRKAARFVCGEVPTTSIDEASAAIDWTVRAQSHKQVN